MSRSKKGEVELTSASGSKEDRVSGVEKASIKKPRTILDLIKSPFSRKRDEVSVLPKASDSKKEEKGAEELPWVSPYAARSGRGAAVAPKPVQSPVASPGSSNPPRGSPEDMGMIRKRRQNELSKLTGKQTLDIPAPPSTTKTREVELAPAVPHKRPLVQSLTRGKETVSSTDRPAVERVDTIDIDNVPGWEAVPSGTAAQVPSSHPVPSTTEAVAPPGANLSLTKNDPELIRLLQENKWNISAEKEDNLFAQTLKTGVYIRAAIDKIFFIRTEEATGDSIIRLFNDSEQEKKVIESDIEQLHKMLKTLLVIKGNKDFINYPEQANSYMDLYHYLITKQAAHELIFNVEREDEPSNYAIEFVSSKMKNSGLWLTGVLELTKDETEDEIEDEIEDEDKYVIITHTKPGDRYDNDLSISRFAAPRKLHCQNLLEVLLTEETRKQVKASLKILTEWQRESEGSNYLYTHKTVGNGIFTVSRTENDHNIIRIPADISQERITSFLIAIAQELGDDFFKENQNIAQAISNAMNKAKERGGLNHKVDEDGKTILDESLKDSPEYHFSNRFQEKCKLNQVFGKERGIGLRLAEVPEDVIEFFEIKAREIEMELLKKAISARAGAGAGGWGFGR